MKCPQAGKQFCLQNNENEKDVHCHDSAILDMELAISAIFVWQSDELAILDMEPIREKTCFDKCCFYM